MKFYYVENEDAVICLYGAYWIVRANTAKEAIDKVFRDSNEAYVKSENPSVGEWRKASNFTGIKKCKLTAIPLAVFINDSNDVFCIK